MGVRNVVLLAEHPDTCMCGGQGGFRLAPVRLRFGSDRVVWAKSWVMPCPLRPGADDLTALPSREVTP